MIESGYIGEVEVSEFVGSSMTGVEVLRVTSVNVIARGRRYGRQWLLKGLREEMRGSAAMRRRLLKEFEIHSRLSHPGIVQAVGLEEIPGLGLCVIEEWIEGRPLSELLRDGKLSKSERRRILREIVNAIGYLHSKGVAHRDLKPANIMVREAGGEPVIIDFGLADTNDYVELKQSAGTEGFISPEQMERGGAHTSDDVYSIGVIMRELCPEYSRIAKTCTGSVNHRPRDARVLLKLIERQERRPKTIALSIAGVLVVVFAAFGLWRISTLSDVANEAQRQVEALSKENLRHAECSARLEDSLQTLAGRLIATEAEMRRQGEYDATLSKVRQEGYRKIDRLLQHYDKEVFSKLTPETQSMFTDAQLRLQKEIRQMVDDYCASSDVASLEKEDRDRMWMDLYDRFTVEFTKYHERWMKRIYPAQSL